MTACPLSVSQLDRVPKIWGGAPTADGSGGAPAQPILARLRKEKKEREPQANLSPQMRNSLTPRTKPRTSPSPYAILRPDLRKVAVFALLLPIRLTSSPCPIRLLTTGAGRGGLPVPPRQG